MLKRALWKIDPDLNCLIKLDPDDFLKEIIQSDAKNNVISIYLWHMCTYVKT